jgi:hypothetical protein
MKKTKGLRLPGDFTEVADKETERLAGGDNAGGGSVDSEAPSAGGPSATPFRFPCGFQWETLDPLEQAKEFERRNIPMRDMENKRFVWPDGSTSSAISMDENGIYSKPGK